MNYSYPKIPASSSIKIPKSINPAFVPSLGRQLSLQITRSGQIINNYNNEPVFLTLIRLAEVRIIGYAGATAFFTISFDTVPVSSLTNIPLAVDKFLVLADNASSTPYERVFSPPVDAALFQRQTLQNRSISIRDSTGADMTFDFAYLIFYVVDQ